MTTGDRRVLDLADDDVNGYQLLNSLVVPRPIAWVSSLDAQGRGNLAPHSFFTVASADPATVLFTSVGEKDTLRNVRATGEFVVNLASAPLRDAVNDSSAPFEAGADEATALGLALEASVAVAPPRVADSPASIECRLLQVVPIGTSYVVLGTVLVVTVREEAMDGDHPAIEHLRPLSRLGRNEWGHPPEVFTLDRPRSVEDVPPERRARG